MLIYVLAFVFVLASFFGWKTYDDLVYADQGERAAAASLIGYHNALILACQGSATLCDSSAAPVAPATMTAAALAGQPAYANPAQAKRWSGLAGAVVDGYLVTVASSGADASGNASDESPLSSATIVARMVEDANRWPESVVRIGSYEASSGTIVFSPAGAASKAVTSTFGRVPIPSGVFPETLADGSAALVSPAYCGGATAASTCAAVAAAAAGASAEGSPTAILASIKNGSKDPLSAAAPPPTAPE